MEADKRIWTVDGPWSKGLYGAPKKTEFYNATAQGGENVVLKVLRNDINKPAKIKIIPGQLRYRVRKIELQTNEIKGQIQHDFKKLGHVDWEPDTEFFLKHLQVILQERKDKIAQSLNLRLKKMLEKEEVFISERQNVFWWKPDEFFLEPLRYLYDRQGPEEREFFTKFINEQTGDRAGTLMLKVTFDFWVG